ncbi:DUF3373 family protein [Sulfurimonas sp.]|uniref:DUF3373 family protein n=1 Tax=Sulfurimonas sp. TaxID=2022749 RepID=UPI0026341420|nr:DUF3373 family protein [Sulfurimonas sp.]
MNKIITLSVLAFLTTSVYAKSDVNSTVSSMQTQIDKLTKKIDKMEKKQKQTARGLIEVKKHDGNDNIKWDVNFRTAYNYLDYKLKNGKSVTNSSLLTNRLWLGMVAAPTDRLTFRGQLAAYSTWGANNLPTNDRFQNVNWRASSKADDDIIKIRQAYFVYRLTDGTHPISFSAGRRPATDGFLANHREGLANPGSPLAHITNMEVDGAMVRIGNAFGLEGSYLKLVLGRSYTNINQPSFMGTPYTAVGAKDENVDFFVVPMSIYNDGQVNLMAQYAAIFNFMGSKQSLVSSENPAGATTGAGLKHMAAISMQIDGLDEDIDFLDSSTLFVSIAATRTDPKDGYKMQGTKNSENGYSFWSGFIFPDLITDNGQIGIEYNYGSKYWAPETWAEDTMSGSKIATRGNAYEAYWNLPFENGHFSTQIRYTYMDYKYKSNIEQFWADPTLADNDVKSTQELRISCSYKY